MKRERNYPLLDFFEVDTSMSIMILYVFISYKYALETYKQYYVMWTVVTSGIRSVDIRCFSI